MMLSFLKLLETSLNTLISSYDIDSPSSLISRASFLTTTYSLTLFVVVVVGGGTGAVIVVVVVVVVVVVLVAVLGTKG